MKEKEKQRNLILILSIIGLMLCIVVLFPQVREGIVSLVEQKMMHGELMSSRRAWIASLFSFAMGGICLFIFINYCIQTESGRKLMSSTRDEIKYCWAEINFRSFLKPSLWMFFVYSLGILTIIRANFLYEDDILRSLVGHRRWEFFSRYVAEISSIIIHANLRITEISPLPQLLAAMIMAVSSVLLVYVINNKKLTVVSLLVSIPLGLSPYFLECFSFKYDAPYMAMSVLASIVPFLFISRKKVFLFLSVIALLIMYMTYQAASGIYLMIVLAICFQDWNTRKKTNKEVFSFAGIALFAFALGLIIFKFFIMKPPVDSYVSTNMHPVNQLIPGILTNLKEYINYINSDLGLVWKFCIVLVVIFFLIKSVHISSQNKLISLIFSSFIVCLSFVLSYGIFYMLKQPLFDLRAMYGFGAWLAILCVYIATNYNKIAKIAALALCWSFFVFAFSYGNALADQKRYTDFRVGLLLHDLSTLYPEDKEVSIQLENKIDYTPSVKLMAAHYPIVKRLRVQMKEMSWEYIYFMNHFNFEKQANKMNEDYNQYILDFNTLDLPVVLETYYHTIKSDGTHVLVILKH